MEAQNKLKETPETHLPDSQIGALVDEVFAKVEAHHGKNFARAIRRLLDNFIAMVLAESAVTGVPPGPLISAFLTTIRAIDKASDEIALQSGDLRKN